MKTLKHSPEQFAGPIDEFWKKINDLIPFAKKNKGSLDDELSEKREFLDNFVVYYRENSPHKHYLSAIDDLNKYGYLGNELNDNETLLLKSIIAVSEKKQGRPLWEVLHMIAFNKSSYKSFFIMYLPIPGAIKSFLGSIIARLENQRKAIKEDSRLKNIWKTPKTILQV